MTDGVEATLYLLFFAAAIGSARALGRGRPARPPVATLAALLVVGIPTAIQLIAAPGLPEHLERSREAIGDGQLWRLATALVVQDGGAAGGLVNLAALAVVGTAAERIWGARRWLVIALVSGIGGELWGLVVQPVGAGNSVVVFGLAASVAAAALRQCAGPPRLLGGLSLLSGAALLATGNVHGGAAAIGAATGAALAGPAPPRRLDAGLVDGRPGAALTPPR